MWGFQQHFQISLKVSAEELFKELDPNFEVKVFLLGLVRNESPTNHPICLEPEECGFEPRDFGSVREDAKHFLAVAPDRNMMATHPAHQRSIESRRERRAESSAVMKAIEDNHHLTDDEFFFSGFMPVADYDVGVILRLHHKHGISHYSLPHVYAEDRYQLPASLTEAVTKLFLQEACASFYVPDPENVADYDGLKTDEILARAGDRLMEAPVFAGRGIEGLYGLFKACNFISSLTYERATSIGEMFIARKGHPNIQATVTLEKPLSLRQHRAVRKLLEISSVGDAILTDGASVTGFGKFFGNYDESKADLLRVRFTGHHKWELCHSDHKLMRVSYGKPALPLPPLNEQRFKADLERIFKGISPGEIKNLFELSEEACRQRHGTVLVITPEAASESKRLASQATGLVPVSLTPDLLKSVTAIDGAVMLDISGICYAIGVILDGEAVEFGNPARGARFNSSLRYAAQMDALKKDCVVVVVSEDGTAEWIPELKPRISQKILKSKEAEADSILNKAEISYRDATVLLNWLSEHRFYLPKSLCEKANLIAEARKKIWDEGKVNIYFEIKPFEPHPIMSDDYLEE